MDHVRRPSLLPAGEPLLLCRSTVETASRFWSFVEESGLPPEAVLSSTLCSMPLPVYTDFGVSPEGRPRRRWDGTRAEFMWHPLMWLPSRVSGRYQINDAATGEEHMEDDDLWAIRVAFEMTASGLYDPDSGTWVDILATVGIDIDDELDLARVQDWMAGYPDEDLDSIDLTDYLTVDPPAWALESALALREDLECASWALIADDLLAMSDDAMARSTSLSHRDQLIALRALAGLGESLLSAVPIVANDGSATAPNPEPHLDFFARLHAAVDIDAGLPETLDLINLLDEARQRLFVIREVYWPRLEALGEMEDDSAPVGV